MPLFQPDIQFYWFRFVNNELTYQPSTRTVPIRSKMENAGVGCLVIQGKLIAVGAGRFSNQTPTIAFDHPAILMADRRFPPVGCRIECPELCCFQCQYSSLHNGCRLHRYSCRRLLWHSKRFLHSHSPILHAVDCSEIDRLTPFL